MHTLKTPERIFISCEEVFCQHALMKLGFFFIAFLKRPFVAWRVFYLTYRNWFFVYSTWIINLFRLFCCNIISRGFLGQVKDLLLSKGFISECQRWQKMQMNVLNHFKECKLCHQSVWMLWKQCHKIGRSSW